jgi:hypothetical protein
VLAVIADHVERAQEVAAQLAADGTTIQTVWYTTPRQFLTQKKHLEFEAVILFPEHGQAAADSEEDELRRAMTGTPLFRVA